MRTSPGRWDIKVLRAMSAERNPLTAKKSTRLSGSQRRKNRGLRGLRGQRARRGFLVPSWPTANLIETMIPAPEPLTPEQLALAMTPAPDPLTPEKLALAAVESHGPQVADIREHLKTHDISYDQTTRLLNKLLKAGLITKPKRGKYTVVS